MKTSEGGISLIKRFEGLELVAYKDIAGVWTIGYGHTSPNLDRMCDQFVSGGWLDDYVTFTTDARVVISEAKAEALLALDLTPRENAVRELTKATLKPNEFAALVSFVYNVGAPAYQGSTARRRLNAGDRLGAAEALTWWNKARVNGKLIPVAGLMRRRAAEKELFLTPINHHTPHRETNVAACKESRPIFR